jgi:hypothetical protein
MGKASANAKEAEDISYGAENMTLDSKHTTLDELDRPVETITHPILSQGRKHALLALFCLGVFLDGEPLKAHRYNSAYLTSDWRLLILHPSHTGSRHVGHCVRATNMDSCERPLAKHTEPQLISV